MGSAGSRASSDSGHSRSRQPVSRQSSKEEECSLVIEKKAEVGLQLSQIAAAAVNLCIGTAKRG
jgi:hypothetical protein